MKTVIILTMPRSGSSLLAGILSKLGVYLGPQEDMEIGKWKNKYGSFENHDFLKINHNILFKAKRLLLYWNRLDDKDGLVEKMVRKYEPELKAAIQKHQRELWGFKEAVLIYTLPYFYQYLPNPYYIVLHRSPESIANSQIKASNLKNWGPEIKVEFSYFKWYQRIRLFLQSLRVTFTKGFIYRNLKFLQKITIDGQNRIENYVQGKKHIKIDLLEITNNPKDTIKKIIKFLEITPTQTQIKEAINFVHPELLVSEVGKKATSTKTTGLKKGARVPLK